MKLIININPYLKLRKRIYVKQNELIIYEGEIKSDDAIIVSGVTDGEVEVGIDRNIVMPLEVKSDSVVFITDTRDSRWKTNILYIALLFDMLLYMFLPDHIVADIVLIVFGILVLIVIFWVASALKPEKKYKVFIA